MRLRTNMKMPETIVCYVGGHVHALDPMTGQTIWKTRLPKAYRNYVGSVVIDGDVVLAGASGRVYCLDRSVGRLLWMNDMKWMGLGMVSVATPSTSDDGSAQSAAAQAASASLAMQHG